MRVAASLRHGSAIPVERQRENQCRGEWKPVFARGVQGAVRQGAVANGENPTTRGKLADMADAK